MPVVPGRENPRMNLGNNEYRSRLMIDTVIDTICSSHSVARVSPPEPRLPRCAQEDMPRAAYGHWPSPFEAAIQATCLLPASHPLERHLAPSHPPRVGGFFSSCNGDFVPFMPMTHPRQSTTSSGGPPLAAIRGTAPTGCIAAGFLSRAIGSCTVRPAYREFGHPKESP